MESLVMLGVAIWDWTTKFLRRFDDFGVHRLILNDCLKKRYLDWPKFRRGS